MKRIFLCAVILLCFMTTALVAQQGCSYNLSKGVWENANGGPCTNTIITSVPFLRITPDARSGAMGDAGIAISPDANAIHFNASKLAFVENDLSLSATYTPWLRALGLNDVYMAYLAGYKRLDELSSLGFGLRYFSLGEINFTNDSGGELGTGRPNEFEINAAYARKLSDNFSLSIGGKFIYSNLAAGQRVDNVEISPGLAGAVDFGLTYKKDIEMNGNQSDLTIGAAITNLGTKISYTNSANRDFIPTNLGIGAAWEFQFDEYNSFTITADVNKLMVPTPCIGDGVNVICDEDENDIPDYREKSVISGFLGSFSDAQGGFSEEMRELMYSVGMEYWYDKQFAVRAGYYTEHQTKGNRQFFTVGLGLKYNVFGLNFSYLVPTTNQRNPLDNTLRFSLIFDFEAFEDEQ
ncbi:MAG: type IX secretion system outer membrane channel protein PorV [Bacteroidota bacterium]